MSFTLENNRDLLRIFIDQPHTGIWSNANLNTLINAAYREIVAEIMRRWPNYYHKESTITTTANTPYVDVPSDCVNVNKIINSSSETLARLDLTQMDFTESNGEPTNFAVTGPHVYFWPEPDAAYTFRIDYHYCPSDLSSDSSVPELPVLYQDILAYGAAVKSRIAKEESLPEYQMQYKNKLDMILHSVAIESTNETPRVKGGYHEFYLFD